MRKYTSELFYHSTHSNCWSHWSKQDHNLIRKETEVQKALYSSLYFLDLEAVVPGFVWAEDENSVERIFRQKSSVFIDSDDIGFFYNSILVRTIMSCGCWKDLGNTTVHSKSVDSFKTAQAGVKPLYLRCAVPNPRTNARSRICNVQQNFHGKRWWQTRDDFIILSHCLRHNLRSDTLCSTTNM